MTIRRQPDDFQVRERLRTPLHPDPDSRHRHAIYELRKTSLTTPEAALRLARALQLRPPDLAWAGLKDKHASTSQHVSALGTGTPLPEQIEGDAWRARRVGWLDRHLAADDIDANEFTIAVRDLTPPNAHAMDARATLLGTGPGSLLFTNYFGEQRFASARHGKGFAARSLALGDFESALRLLLATPARKDSGPRRTLTRLAAAHWGHWDTLVARAPRSPLRRPFEALAAGGSFPDAFESLPHVERQFAVEAYQSWLWNAGARAVCASFSEHWSIASDFGEFAFAPASNVPPDWRARRGAMPSPALAPGDAWREALLSVLDEQGLRPEQLRVPGARRPRFDDFERGLFVRADLFHMEPPRPDELARSRGRLARTLRFSLPSGAYATVLLRALGA